MPRDRQIIPEDTVLLASFDQWGELRGHAEVAAATFSRGEPVRVDREEGVEPVEFLPGGAEHTLQRFGRLTALRLGIVRRLSDLATRAP